MVGRIERNADGLLVRYGTAEGWDVLGGEISSVGPFGIFKIVLNKKRHQDRFWGKKSFVSLGAKFANEWIINDIEFFIEEQNASGDTVELSYTTNEDLNTTTPLANVNLNNPVGSTFNFGPFVLTDDALLVVDITDANPNDLDGKVIVTIKYTV